MLKAWRGSTAVHPEPDSRASCPECMNPVLSKCGTQVIWHWAHESLGDCSGGGVESEWHRAWKSRFPFEWIEYRDGGFRADVRGPRGHVIEFQRSSIDVRDIIARDAHWKSCRWVFDVSEQFARRDFTVSSKGILYWDRPPVRIVTPELTPLLDVGEDVVYELGRWYWRWKEHHEPGDRVPIEGPVKKWNANDLAKHLTELLS